MTRLTENYMNGLYALGWPVNDAWIEMHIPEGASPLIEGLGVAYTTKYDAQNLQISKAILADWLEEEGSELAELIRCEIAISNIRGDADGVVDGHWLRMNDIRRKLGLVTQPAPIMCIDGPHKGEWHTPLMEFMMIGSSHYKRVRMNGRDRFQEHEPVTMTAGTCSDSAVRHPMIPSPEQH